jgi:cyclopropane fatty-acyl-phospholipid synthase-like methyltransferase
MNIPINTLFLLLSVIFIVLVLTAIIYLIFNIITPFFFQGIFYVPSQRERIKKMLEFADIKPGELACDLGSGDGRLVIALAQAGAEAHGYEINPLLVILARIRIRRAGYSGRAIVHWKNFWNENFSRFDVITIYGMTFVMKKLEKKLKQELKPGARVISNAFTFPAWPPAQKDNGVYLYK